MSQGLYWGSGEVGSGWTLKIQRPLQAQTVCGFQYHCCTLPSRFCTCPPLCYYAVLPLRTAVPSPNAPTFWTTHLSRLSLLQNTEKQVIPPLLWPPRVFEFGSLAVLFYLPKAELLTRAASVRDKAWGAWQFPWVSPRTLCVCLPSWYLWNLKKSCSLNCADIPLPFLFLGLC